jgi:hypothetical protein
MSLTQRSVVNLHLLSNVLPPLTMEAYPVVLVGTDDVALPHANWVEESDVVKVDVQVQPSLNSAIVLKSNEWTTVGAVQLVPASDVLTLSASLSTIYRNELDYQLDCVQGNIRRVLSGAIPDYMNVWLYYRAYNVFARGQDYVVDGARGTLHRTSDGAIPDGARVLVDYTVTAGSARDALVDEAILEAEDLIVRRLASGYDGNSTDQGLKTGATDLALSIIVRAMAGDALGHVATSDAAGRAREWQKLSEMYEARAWETLRPFLDPLSFHAPEKLANA